MSELYVGSTRRQFVRSLAFGATALTAPGAFAEALVATPRSTEGPFYPDKLPLDTDNDLLIINDSITPAVGTITHLTGKVVDLNGNPLRNAVVEIWQVDGNGVYIHSRSAGHGKLDSNFQGFGRFLTNNRGEYYFRTIRPTRYPGRTPHIHFAINQNGRRILTTQMYVKGEPLNEKDGLLQRISDDAARNSVIIDFKPLEGSKLGEHVANFDIVVGRTPEDA
ncbi:protocatechuate 3,4-dioxygenase [Pirellulales bacterium]|nr:protocatechuate 3,4-dioxygenase [Pirellulales bacterium]